MFKKSARLTAAEVKEVLKHGRSVRIGSYAGKLLPRPGALKVAVIVPKSTARLATARNRLRRAAYRELALVALPKEGALALFVRK